MKPGTGYLRNDWAPAVSVERCTATAGTWSCVGRVFGWRYEACGLRVRGVVSVRVCASSSVVGGVVCAR